MYVQINTFCEINHNPQYRHKKIRKKFIDLFLSSSFFKNLHSCCGRVNLKYKEYKEIKYKRSRCLRIKYDVFKDREIIKFRS